MCTGERPTIGLGLLPISCYTRVTASHAAMPFFAAMLRRSDHEDGTMPLLICALYFPTIPYALPANDHSRSPTMCHDERATYARLPALSAISLPKWASSSLLHHSPSGVQSLQLRPLRRCASDLPSHAEYRKRFVVFTHLSMTRSFLDKLSQPVWISIVSCIFAL